MISAFFHGFSFGATLIIAIGAQNAFVIRNGLTKKHLFLTAILCSSIDAVLILLGVFGFGTFIGQYPAWLLWANYLAILFLLAYGVLSLWAALKPKDKIDENTSISSMKKVILSILAFSLLNPHVYLDTVILLGSIAAQEEPSMQSSFALGAICASFTWFFSLSYGASFCARWLRKPGTQRALDFAITLIMWSIAIRLIAS
jgi:L-lysine exporter family protein LysE/ArgO